MAETERLCWRISQKQPNLPHRCLFHSLSSGMIYAEMLTDERGKPADFRVLDANDVFQKQSGVANPAGRLGSEILGRGSQPDRDLLEFLGRVTKSGIPERAELFLPSLGEWCSLSVFCPHAGHFIASLDIITERKRDEEALRESRERLEFALRGGQLGMWDWNPGTGAVSYSEGWAEMLGYRPDEVENHVSFFERHLHPEDRPHVLARLNAHVNGLTAMYDSVHRLCTKGGNWLWIIDRGKITERDPQGRATRVTGVISDISELRRAEALAQSGRAKLGAALASMADAVVICDQEGRITDFNDAYLMFHRFDSRDAAVKTVAEYQALFDFLTPNGLPVAKDREPLSRALRGERITCAEFSVRRNDTQETWVGSFSVAPIYDKTHALIGAVATARDMTERHLKERELENQRLFTETLLDTLAEGIVACDSLGALTLFNRTARDWHELDVLTIPPERWVESYHLYAEDEKTPVPLDEIPLLRAFRGEVLRDVPMTIVRPGHSPRHLLISGGPIINAKHATIGAVVSLHDITERLKAEEETTSLARRLRLAADAAQLGVWDLDLILGRLIWDQRMLEIYGLTEGNLFSGTLSAWENALLPSDRARTIEEFQAGLRSKTTWTMTFRILRPDGNIRHIKADCIALRDQNGQATRILGVNADITGHQEAQLALERVHRLESLGTLAGGIAHDFNNIMTGLFGYIELIKIRCADQPIVLHDIDMALSAFDRARALTRQLLTFAKGGAPIKTMVDMRDLLREAANLALCGTNITAQFQFDEAGSVVFADTHQIKQAIDNLIANAKQSMPHGGTLLIATSRITPDSVRPPILPEGTWVGASITDQGYGIPEENLTRIFDPFFTTKPNGTGLGLSMVHSIVTRHGGFIDVTSKEGIGSTFAMYLPASESEGPKNLAPETSERPWRVLVMDDEALIRELAATFLTKLGCHVELASNAGDAVRIFGDASRAGEPHDLVILDLTIPGGMGGIETLQMLRNIDRGVRALVSSGYSDDPAMANPEAFGFVASLAKPYRLSDLQAALRLALKASHEHGPTAPNSSQDAF
jgi:PAS domain S-box-containing protein